MSYGFGRVNDLAAEIHKWARRQGFWDVANVAPGNFTPSDVVTQQWARTQISEKLALIHSEVSEALEELRARTPLRVSSVEEDGKTVGFPSELADIIIRTLDLAEFLEINIEQEIVNKMQYNETRPYKNGKAF